MPVDTSGAMPPPPRKAASSSRTRTSEKAAAVAISAKQEAYQNTLGEITGILTMGLATLNFDADAAAIQIHSPAAIPAWAELAMEIEPLGAFLDAFNKAGGKYVKLTMATLPLVMQLAANHGLVKAGPFNTQPPELLRARMLAAKAQQAREVREAIREAQEEAERLMGEAQEDPAA